MNFDLLLLASYMVAVILLTITPGVDTALIIQSTLGGKTTNAYRAAVGIVLGCAVWGVLVALGLGAVITSSEVLYYALKTIGAGYLVWIGIAALRGSANAAPNGHIKSESSSHYIKRGFLANMLNPKVGLFYLSLLPQFVPETAQVTLYSLFLVGIHILLSLVWFWIVIHSIKRTQQSVMSHRVTTYLEKFTGILFIGFGLKLLASSR
ncbi:MAG: LysE family translocator [Alphaproteobacteria bacterium]|jgi:threonine/homoserine/homoserine lactone efflux protein